MPCATKFERNGPSCATRPPDIDDATESDFPPLATLPEQFASPFRRWSKECSIEVARDELVRYENSRSTLSTRLVVIMGEGDWKNLGRESSTLNWYNEVYVQKLRKLDTFYVHIAHVILFWSFVGIVSLDYHNYIDKVWNKSENIHR